MAKRRQERVSEQIHEDISAVLHTRVRDPRLTQVTVTGVQVSPDLRMATVYVTTLGDSSACQAALEGLDHATSFVRRELAHRLGLRYMPELRFMLDESWQRGSRIDKLLEQLPPAASEAEAAPDDVADSSAAEVSPWVED